MKIWRMALTGLAFAIGLAVYGGSQGRISQAAETEEAKTIFPFVAGEDNDAEEILQAISQLQPGALLGDALMLSSEVTEQEIGEWVQELGVLREEILPEAGGDTVASAVVTPSRQQVLYLWEGPSSLEATRTRAPRWPRH